MQRRLGSKLQKGIIGCLNDEGLTNEWGFNGRTVEMIIEYLEEKKIIKHPDRRRKDYEKRCFYLYTSVLRAIRNMARNEPKKGIYPVVQVKKDINLSSKRKVTFRFRINRSRIGTKEFWSYVWNYFVYPMEIKILEAEENEPLKEFFCKYCQKIVKAESFEKHLNDYHEIELERYNKIFKKSM